MDLRIGPQAGTLLHGRCLYPKLAESWRNLDVNALQDAYPSDPWPPLAVAGLGPVRRLHERRVEFGRSDNLHKNRDALGPAEVDPRFLSDSPARSAPWFAGGCIEPLATRITLPGIADPALHSF